VSESKRRAEAKRKRAEAKKAKEQRDKPTRPRGLLPQTSRQAGEPRKKLQKARSKSILKGIKKHPFVSALGFAASCILAFFTISEGISQFYPFILIEPNQETSTENFADTRFIITNTSSLTVHNVNYWVWCWDGDTINQQPAKNVFSFIANNPPDSLGPHTSMSARVDFSGYLTGPLSGPYSDPRKINRPIYGFFVWYDLFGMKFRTGKTFWASRGRDGIYRWNPGGDAKIYKPTERFPDLNPP
jgi:hypothetical protein